MTVETTVIDLNQALHCQHLVELLNAYAQDPMGGGEPLAPDVQARLPQELAKQDSYIGFIIYVDGQPAALANCFKGFSTFACRPLLNIHDVVVAPDFRGQGLSTVLMENIASHARSLGCCKLTLEVLSGNDAAINAYKKCGFKLYQLDERMGSAQFMECKLN